MLSDVWGTPAGIVFYLITSSLRYPPTQSHFMICALVPSLPNKTNYSTELVCSSGITVDFFQKQFMMLDASVLKCPEFQSDLPPKGGQKNQALNSVSD